MSDELKFRISSGLKNIIGRDLITDEYIAVFELVKNSFDAHATEVEIIFENIFSENGKIIIMDNGKGMNYDDLINKWLFVAYSAKKDGTEDLDYRDKINSRFYYAGAKGIGRFSCDKLGTNLRLISKKDGTNSKIEEIKVDWTKFEENAKAEFVNISVDHQVLEINPSKFKTGTYLEITGLRPDANWGGNKIIKLKHSLSKLINPFEADNNRNFNINVVAEEFKRYDEGLANPYWRINGYVVNNLLSVLKNKTIHIKSEISADGHTISTEFSKDGESLYKIVERNIEYRRLSSILIELYYLDKRARYNFTRAMGIRAHDYGSVFLYKNNIRIYPYGEPGENSFSLDTRQQKRIGQYVGTRELIGRVEISGDNEEFKETTSRGDGLVKNESYFQLESYLINSVISKLENYVMKFLKYGIEFKRFEGYNDNLEGIINYISGVQNSNVISIDFNSNLLEIIGLNQEENKSAFAVLNSIENIARNSGNNELLENVQSIKQRLEDALTTAQIAEEEIREKDKIISERTSENLFLKSVKSQDLDEVVSFLHHIGIGSKNIDNELKLFVKQLRKGKEIDRDQLLKTLDYVLLENRKILTISKFASKANFKLFTSSVEIDVIEYISEYIENILGLVSSQKPVILISKIKGERFIKNVKPIELNIIIDNLISNSRRAKAETIEIIFNTKKTNLEIRFIDDGIGINREYFEKVFEIGFTTTSGSGIGLYHIRKILEDMNGSIKLNLNNDKKTEFIITI
ncbi:ATP-binding protein [Flavobacterium sp. AS60]|uniref:ATP-binding protein n=1 Tax=Flavobacterium anseongense TaxID=2910677 RepID=UPI001F24D61C|nr:ATP-binding protein [Flavobacterium sp. AS60]MCF6129566.1 ATP-binding protein [Flavobacterium sp. AS60]